MYCITASRTGYNLYSIVWNCITKLPHAEDLSSSIYETDFIPSGGLVLPSPHWSQAVFMDNLSKKQSTEVENLVISHLGRFSFIQLMDLLMK